MLKIKLFDDCGYPLSFIGVDFPVVFNASKCRYGYDVMGSELIKAGDGISPSSLYLILPHECEVMEELRKI